MTTAPQEAPSPPWVELGYAPAQLSEADRRRLISVNAGVDPHLAWREALLAFRVFAINRIRQRFLTGNDVLTADTLRTALNYTWELYAPTFGKTTGPMVAEAYVKAFQRANAGDVPIQMIYNLADEHSRRVGEYFNSTSNEALIQGFNTYVNRRVPEKAALAKVLDGYGLAPRQMSGMTSSKQFDAKVESASSQTVKQRVQSYIAKSIDARLDLFGRQETHNLNQQADQVAWMWMVEHNKLPVTTMKQWITAKDERVCPICGPMQGTKVPIKDRFVLDNGQELYVPGAHVNCRCHARLVADVVNKSAFGIVTFAKDSEFEHEHPRDQRGRFTAGPDQNQGPQRQRTTQPERRRAPEVLEREPEVATEAEEMIRAAQQVERLEEEAREGIGLTEVKMPGAGLGQVREGLTVRQGLTTQRGLTTQQGLQAAVPTPTGLTETARRLTMARDQGLTQPATRLVTKTGQPLEVVSPRGLVLNTLEMLRRQEVREAARPSRPRTLIRNAVEFFPGYPERRVYIVGKTSDLLDPHEERVLLTDDVHDFLKPYDEKQVTQEIAAQYQRNAEDVKDAVFDPITHHHEPTDFAWEDDDGARFRTVSQRLPIVGRRFAHLTEDDVDQIISAVAHERKDAFLPVEWFDARSQVYHNTENVNAQELGEMLGIDKADLEVSVVKLQYGFPDAYQVQTGTRYGEELWTAPGNYKITDQVVDSDAIGVAPTRMVEAAPEVGEYEIPGD